MLINDASITGSLIVNASSSFQNIAVSGNILPGTNNVYNLGSVDKFFKEIFVSTGSINFVDNTGIKTTISSVAGGGIQIGSVQITTSSISFVDITGSVTQTIAQSSSLGSTSNFTPTALFNEYTQSFSSSVSTSFSSSAASVTSLSSSVSASITSLSSSLTSVNTTQNSRLTTIESVTGSYETNGRGIVSGSSQITYTNISSIPSGIISSSAQLENANITNLTITNLTTVNQTASVLFTSGSNRFGDFGDDTHSFTGSVKISGSFTLVGASTATSYNGTINATNGVVSGSSQVDLTTTTNYASGILTRLNTVGVVSGSKTISGITLGSNLATLTIGTGLSGTSYNGSTAVTIANSGVTSIVAGTGISINQGTAAVTVTNTITNNNQLTNGAGYITSAGNAATVTNGVYTAGDQTIGGIKTFSSKIIVGTFSNSTTNTGEAWFGRASDRNTGTYTIQLGGNSATNRQFEVVDYGWSVVLFSVGSNGNATASGDITAYSDARIKTNIKPIDSSLEKVLKLTGVTYNRTDLDDKTTKIGFIAQEVQKIIPEVVTYNKEQDRYGVSYGNITALLVEAIKEQQIKIDNLTIEVENLKKPKGL